MFGNTGGHPLRPMGVKHAEEGARGQGKPQTLVQLMPAKMYVGQFYDENGRLQPITLVEVAGEYYGAPNAIEWTRQLKPASKWMREQIKSKLSDLSKVEVPDTDEVDVMGGGNPVAGRIAAESEERREDL